MKKKMFFFTFEVKWRVVVMKRDEKRIYYDGTKPFINLRFYVNHLPLSWLAVTKYKRIDAC